MLYKSYRIQRLLETMSVEFSISEIAILKSRLLDGPKALASVEIT